MSLWDWAGLIAVLGGSLAVLVLVALFYLGLLLLPIALVWWLFSR